MRNIDCALISETVEELCLRANTWLPPDIAILLECCSETERPGPGREALCDLVENFKYAAESGIPICQDTGMAVVFIDLGQEVHITGGLLADAVNEGVRRAYTDRLRCSVVADPLRRVNTDDNTPAVVHLQLVEGDRLDITVAPKGFGSENMSALKMFTPSATGDDIADFIVQTVREAGAKPCPPVILGVGLGGTSEQAMYLAKRALCHPIDEKNPDKFYEELERSILDKVNALGIGPQGFGGDFTALAVSIEQAPTHIAGLPCALCFGCHATRHAHANL